MDVAKAVDASLKVLVLYGFIGAAVSCLYPGHCATIWDAPCGSSVISSGATWPRRSRVAWTLDWKPLASLLADWPRLRPAMPDCSFVQPSMATILMCLG